MVSASDEDILQKAVERGSVVVTLDSGFAKIHAQHGTVLPSDFKGLIEPCGSEPTCLRRDRDAIYGETFRTVVKSMGIKEVMNSRQSTWQNPPVERVIGSICSECTHLIISLSERHLLCVLKEYTAYYNESCTHLSLVGSAPEPREVETTEALVTEPLFGGQHHRYRSDS